MTKPMGVMVLLLRLAVLLAGLALTLYLSAGCGDIRTVSLGSGDVDASVSDDSAHYSDVANDHGEDLSTMGEASTPTCVSGCVPTCGASATSVGCLACPTSDAGAAVMACGPQGFQVCCRYVQSGIGYCSAKDLCQ